MWLLIGAGRPNGFRNSAGSLPTLVAILRASIFAEQLGCLGIARQFWTITVGGKVNGSGRRLHPGT